MSNKKPNKRVSPNEVYSYLISKGVSTQHALGMMANIKHESNFIPTAVGDNGTSAGLFMHHNSRYDALKKHTKGDLTNWKKQIDYALTEPDTKKYLSQKFTTPEKASYWFTTQWERPSNAGSKAVQRQGWIKEFMVNRGKNWEAPTYNPEGLSEEELYASNMPTAEGEYQAEVPADVLAQQQKRDQEVEDLRAENKRLSEKEDEETAAERERLSKEKQELLAAEEEQMKQTQFADALAEVKPQAPYQEPTEDASRNPELYQQNLGFEVQQAQNLFQGSIPTPEVQEAKYGGYFGDGGKQVKEKPADQEEFKKFHDTLPKNLQDPNFETADYSAPDQYNLYGMWETVGKPKSFEEVKDGDYFPLQRDGTYHGFTVGGDNEFLKPINHPTVGKELWFAKYSDDPYFRDNQVIVNEKGRYEYVPNYGVNNSGPRVQNFDYDFETIDPNEETTEYAYGGEVDDSTEFNNFYQSLPISLQSEDKLDNLYTLWKESGKVSSYSDINQFDNFDFERQVLEYGDGGVVPNFNAGIDAEGVWGQFGLTQPKSGTGVNFELYKPFHSDTSYRGSASAELTKQFGPFNASLKGTIDDTSTEVDEETVVRNPYKVNPSFNIGYEFGNNNSVSLDLKPGEFQVGYRKTFDLGGTFDKLLDPNNITAFKQKYGIE
jgi:hypothetical protein